MHCVNEALTFTDSENDISGGCYELGTAWKGVLHMLEVKLDIVGLAKLEQLLAEQEKLAEQMHSILNKKR